MSLAAVVLPVLGLLALLAVVSAVALVLVLLGRSARPAATEPAMLVAARRHAGWTTAVACLAAAVALVLLLGWGQLWRPGGTAPGLLTGLAPSVAGLVFVGTSLVGERTWPRPTGTVRVASLVPRSVADLAPRRRSLLWAWVALTAVAVVVFGLLSDDGTSISTTRVLDDGAVETSAAGPFPGWAYGPALLAGSLVVAGAAEHVLRRVARRPAVMGAVGDGDLRRRSAARVVRGAQLAVAVTLAGLLATAGVSLANAVDFEVGSALVVLGLVVGLVGVVAAGLPTAPGPAHESAVPGPGRPGDPAGRTDGHAPSGAGSRA